MTRFLRGFYIVLIVLRYGLDELVLTSFQKPGLRLLARIVSIGRDLSAPRGQRLREALEHLGPIFVKFGQVLSTRRDLIPLDIADELATEAPIPSPIFDMDSLPSWPSLPNPKHFTKLSTSTTHVWVSPAERYPIRSRLTDVDPPPTSA